jgi:hypothetical protein
MTELYFSVGKLGRTGLGSDDWVSYGGIIPPKFKSLTWHGRLHFCVGNIQIYSMNSQEIQGNLNIIKITLRFLNHLTTTIAAARASRRRATVAAPIPESA